MCESNEAPKAPSSDRLFWMWLRSSDVHPKAFLTRLQLWRDPFSRAVSGWLRKRQRMGSGDVRLFEAAAARSRLSVLWWELLARLGEEWDRASVSEAELKRLAAAAAIVKAAQAGLGALGAFDADDTEPVATTLFEGLDVERL